MKVSKLQCALFLLLIGLLITPNNTFAQTDGTKTITIIKKTVDKDGNTNVEKTIIEGDEAKEFDVDKYMRSIDESKYADVNINVEVAKDGEEKSSGKEKVIEVNVEGDDIIIMEDGKKTVVKMDKEGTREEFKTADGKHIKIIRKTADANSQEMEVEVMHTEGEGGKKEIRIIKTSQPKGAFFGVMIDPSAGGVTLLDVVKGSPAEKAGLQKGDVLQSINEHNVSGYNELTEALSKYKVGDTIVAVYKRDGQVNKVRAKLGDAKEMNLNTEKMIWKTDDGEVIEMKEGQEFIFEEKSEDGKKKIKKKIIIKEGNNGNQ